MFSKELIKLCETNIDTLFLLCILDNWKTLKYQRVEIDNMTVVVPLPKPAAHLTISSSIKPSHPQKGKHYYYCIFIFKNFLQLKATSVGIRIIVMKLYFGLHGNRAMEPIR